MAAGPKTSAGGAVEELGAVDHHSLDRAPADEALLVAGLEAEDQPPAVDLDELGGDLYVRAQRARGQVLQFDAGADGRLTGSEMRVHRLDRRRLGQREQPRSGEHRDVAAADLLSGVGP